MFYRFLRGKIPLDQNNQANGLVQGGLTPYDPVAFSKFIYRKPLRTTTPSSQLLVAQSWLTAGLGGVVNGQFVFQPLIPNPNSSQNNG